MTRIIFLDNSCHSVQQITTPGFLNRLCETLRTSAFSAVHSILTAESAKKRRGKRCSLNPLSETIEFVAKNEHTITYQAHILVAKNHKQQTTNNNFRDYRAH